MNLCFVWVREFKNLQRVGLNLSNEFEFQFHGKARVLDRHEKDPMPSLFGEQVTSITGILGVNGSGKTNSLELICRALKNPDKIKTEYLLIYSFEGSLFYLTNIKDEIQSSFPISAGAESYLECFHTIYFSNVFDKNYIDFGSGVEDVSVNNKNNPRTLAFLKRGAGSDFLNDLKFLRSMEFEKIELQPPKKIEVKVDRFISRHDRSLEVDAAKPILNYFAEMRRSNKSRSKVHVVAQTIQIEFLKALLVGESGSEEFISSMNSILVSEGDPDLRSFIKSFREVFFTADQYVPWDHKFRMCDTLLVLLNLESFFEKMLISIEDAIKSSRYSFTIDYEHSETFYYTHLACILMGVRYSSIAWAGVSSGQRAYLNLFSSIWNGMSNVLVGRDNIQGALICIDEGDLYLHPQWQIEFVDRLIKSLPELSAGKIQIVITTHSPILISDLPRQCIILLDKQREILTSLPVLGNDAPKTFAANLYDIYQYSFGLEKKRSGNLSSRYLERIYKLLDNDKLSVEDLHELRLAASVIDDEIIKFHIKSRIDAQ